MHAIHFGHPRRHHLLRSVGLSFAALALSVSTAYAAPIFDQPDPDFNGRLSSFGAPALPAGKAVISGRSVKPGQEVTLSSYGTVLNPDIPLSGQDKFTSTAKKMAPGVYQSAYSEKTKRLFVTTAVGRPPVKESQLLKVNPETLDIEAKVTPAAQPGRDDGQLSAVYGVASDDAHGHVWVTNTRSGSVAVYKQSDLSLVKQLDLDVANHARDIVIDTERSRAYVSTPGTNQITVFDTTKLAPAGKIELVSNTKDHISPMSLVLDSKAGKLYTVSMSTSEAVVIDLNAGKVEKIIALPQAKALTGVGLDTEGNRLFVTAQGSDNVLIVDLSNGKVLHNVPVGAGPLNVVYDPVSKYAYVAIRGAGTLAVLNSEGKIVANLDAGSNPNHISTDGQGNLFVLNKSKGKDDQTADRLTRLTVKK